MDGSFLTYAHMHSPVNRHIIKIDKNKHTKSCHFVTNELLKYLLSGFIGVLNISFLTVYLGVVLDIVISHC